MTNESFWIGRAKVLLRLKLPIFPDEETLSGSVGMSQGVIFRHRAPRLNLVR